MFLDHDLELERPKRRPSFSVVDSRQTSRQRKPSVAVGNTIFSNDSGSLVLGGKVNSCLTMVLEDISLCFTKYVAESITVFTFQCHVLTLMPLNKSTLLWSMFIHKSE